jgi:hypothetical protein
LESEGSEGWGRTAQDAAEADGFEVMIARLQEMLSPTEPWEQQVPGFWSATIWAPDPLSLWLSVPTSNPESNARVETLALGEDLRVPFEARDEVAMFCVLANRFFRSWNLYLQRFDTGEYVNSVGSFIARESREIVPPDLIETMVLRSVKAAVVSAPAIRALLDGRTATEALAIADEYDDEFGAIDHLEGRPANPLTNVELVDDAVAALAPIQITGMVRHGPTRLLLIDDHSDDELTPRSLYVDAVDEEVVVNAYPIAPDIPEERLPPMAELMNLIATRQVGFALALDQENGIVRLSNSASFAAVNAGRAPLLRDLILGVWAAADVYQQALHQVAYELIDPAEALAETGEDESSWSSPEVRDDRDEAALPFETAGDPVHLALASAARRLGLDLVDQGEDGPIRIFGPPGRFDAFYVTEIWCGGEASRIECGVPMLIPEDRLEQALELCLGLNTQGRVAFGIGRRGTPVACHNVRTVGNLSHLADAIEGAIGVTLDRASAARNLFSAVVDGVDAATVLGGVDPDTNRELFELLPLARFPLSSVGTEWEGVLNLAPPLPADEILAEDQTESDWRVAALVRRDAPDTDEISNACAGPVLIHEDGRVECYGCLRPDLVPHLKGSTVLCKEGMHLGDGHRCDRCGGGDE